MRRFLLKLFRRRRFERDMAEEMAFHREMAQAGGNAVPFGNQAVIAEQARDVWRFTWVENLWRDVVYGARGLARTPGFALTAVVTLALGIAANVIVFAVADAALFKPLPYRDPDSLVVALQVRGRGTGYEVRQTGTSWRQVEFFRSLPHIFSDVVPFRGPQPANVNPGSSGPSTIGEVSPELFTLFGIRPQLGRVFRPDETADDVVLLAEPFWRSVYGARRDVVGQHLMIDGRPHVVIGVMPDTFKWTVGGDHVAGWRPLDEIARPSFRGWVDSVLRLRPGLTIDGAERGLRAAVAASPEADSSGVLWDLELRSLDTRSALLGSMSQPLLVLLGAVGCLLLIGCANIANLLIARGVSRQHELAVRSALGASRGRLFVQLLVEGSVLGVVSGGVAAGLAWWSLPLVPRLLPLDLPAFVANPPAVDIRLLAFGCVTVAVTCVLSSVAAAVQAAREVAHGLRPDAGRSGSARGGRPLRVVLQGVQVALALVLLASTFLFTRNFLGVVTADLGYDSEGLLAAAVTLPKDRYPDRVSRESFLEALLARVRLIPSVHAATVGMSPAGGLGTRVVARGREDVSHSTSVYHVAPDYFRVAGISLVAGRYFDSRDAANSEPVAIVDASLAALLWPGQSGVGQRLRDRPNRPWLTVTGVVSPIRTGWFTLQASDVQLYVPAAQASSESQSLLVRSDAPPAQTFESMRAVLQAMDSGLQLEFSRAVEGEYERSVSSPRFYFVLMFVLGALGAVTAVVGVYASASYAVSQRTREIGIRLALGADPVRVRLELVRETLGPALGGAVTGLVAAFWLGQYVTALLYQVDARDPSTLTGAALLLVTATALGALIPARRASRMDPAATLRAE